ncbi:hypothetical protein GUJ93_ZPchr0005g16235 [Zizania palustris]|uniref:Uncharacterized protein n=1 Tax=Zizania palustris TaxID=103762 RepID=A0A8J5W086_ZIZPA|nr:hypothetical protein GUJ93_ZPchr0005g16235 [Zizania palustris]
MFRWAANTAIAAPPSDSEVRVQKVDKIDLVFNILTKPQVYGYGSNPKGGGAGNTTTASRGGVFSTVEDINKRSENYIREKKRLFLAQK